MKKGWDIRTLGELCLFENGDRGENYPSKAVQTSSGVPFINAGHLTETGIDFSEMNYIPRERFDLLGNGKIRKNDVLFCLRGSLGKFASVGDLNEGAIASSLVIVRPSAALLNEFLLAYLQSDLSAAMIHKFKNGAAQPNLAAASLKKFEIPLPPLPEQRRIVAVLDEAFAGLATARANAEKNLQNARALFDSRLNDVFSKRGDGWVEKRLDELYRIGSSKRVLKSQWKPEGVPFYRGREVTRLACFGFVDNELFITEEHFAELSNVYGVPRVDDIVITAIGTIGNAYIVRHSDRFYFKDASVLWMQRIADVSSVFIKYWLKSSLFFEQLDRGNGATVDTLTIQKLQSVELHLPPKGEQLEIVAHLDALSAETRRLAAIYERKLAALDELKKSILRQAFNGEL